MIASRESSRFLSPARSMFTRKPVSVIRSTPDFPRSLAGARALSRPTHTAAGFWPRNTLADGEFEPAIEKLLAHPNVDYLQVNSTTAGCSLSALSVPPLHERCPGIQGVSPIPSHRQLPHFASFHHKLRLDRPGLSSSLQWTDCKPIILGVRSGEPHPSQALCQSFPEAGPISAVAGSQGSGGGGT